MNVKIGLEVHAPFSLSSGWADGYMNMIRKTGTKFFGFIPDMGIFCQRIPDVVAEQAREMGASEECIQIVDECYAQRIAKGFVKIKYDTNLGKANMDYRMANGMLEMIERVDSKNFGINFDTGNFLRLLDDPIAGMEKLAPYVFSTHIKDLKMHPTARPNDWYFFCGVPVGFGLIDNMKLAELLHKANYQGFLAVEIDAPAPEWLNMEKEAIAISVKNLRKIGNKFK